jgi:hypothetical protein
MAFIGLILLVVSAISIIYPLRFLMIPDRLVTVCGVVLSLAVIGSTAPPAQTTTKAGAAAERKPAYTSSGGCKTDINGDIKCSHSSELNLFGSSSKGKRRAEAVQG